MKPPEKNHNRMDIILVEQFLRKGYQHTEIHEQDATIIIFRHNRMGKVAAEPETLKEMFQHTYTDFIKAN